MGGEVGGAVRVIFQLKKYIYLFFLCGVSGVICIHTWKTAAAATLQYRTTTACRCSEGWGGVWFILTKHRIEM